MAWIANSPHRPHEIDQDAFRSLWRNGQVDHTGPYWDFTRRIALGAGRLPVVLGKYAIGMAIYLRAGKSLGVTPFLFLLRIRLLGIPEQICFKNFLLYLVSYTTD